MSANGKVCTGFSKPYVAVYSNAGTTVSYSKGQVLARGVSVSLKANTSDDNKFYADNMDAENEKGTFKDGEITLVVDGLLEGAEKLIMGLPEAGADGLTPYDDDQIIPYVAIGYIARYQSEGVESYVPVVIPKCAFGQISSDHKTQEDGIDWQTQELTAVIHRDDSPKHVWKYFGSECETEEAAEAIIKTKFSISAV